MGPGTRIVGLLAALGAGGVGQTFVDVTAAAGLEQPQQLPSYDPFAEPFTPENWQGGVVVGDLDGDGWDDVYWHCGVECPNALFLNARDGTFVDVAPSCGLDVQAPTADASLADYDDDGDLDLFMTTYADVPYGEDPAEQRNFLFRNDGAGGDLAFTDVTEAAGLAVSGRSGSAWGDLDGDLDLDLVTVSWRTEDPTFVYRNDGGGSFTDVTPANVSEDDVRGFAPTLVDYDEDGDLDLLTTGDFMTSRVYRNDGGFTFTDVTQTVVDGGPLDDDNGMGSAFGDVNGDGHVDWYVASIYIPPEIDPPGVLGPKTGNRLWTSNGDGTFSDVTDAAGVREGGWGWGCAFADLDNDADLDLVAGNGFFVGEEEHEPWIIDDPLKVFLNDGSGVFSESAAALGLSHVEQDRGIALFDYDQDGAIDILLSSWGKGLTLYRNTTAAPAEWLRVELRGGPSNARGLGARVEVSGAVSGTQTRWVLGRDHYLSSGPSMAWFGTPGDAEVEVTVSWPNGNVTTRTVATGQRVVIEESPPWIDLGSALAGTDGVAPALWAAGTLEPDTVNALRLTSLPTASVAALVVGEQAASQPFKGGVLVPLPLGPALLLPADRFGTFQAVFSVPAAPAGNLVLQALVADRGAPKGVALSNAMQLEDR